VNRKRALWLSLGYVLLSIILWLLGWLLHDRLLEAAPLLYIGVQWILGPLAFPLNVGGGIVEGSLRDSWVMLYAAVTALLAVCLFLVRRARWIRIMGILMAIFLWLASGWMNFMAMFAGV